jgi:aminopeptidase YwaD
MFAPMFVAPLLLSLAAPAAPLLTPAETRAIADQVSGSAAKRTVQALSLHHRMRGSEGYRAAAELIRDRLRDYGLEEVDVISLPADGRIFYGTQRSRPAWNASFAELWEERQQGGRWADAERAASWADQPISLAQDSASGAAEGELVDVGAGTSAADYAGKDVRGKIVLTSSQPGAVAHEAVTVRGAAGIVSWAQNQKSGWWGDDQSLVRWGHLDTWDDPTWAFMVSPARARAWQARLATGETVRVRARVEAGRSPGAYLIPTAVIAGTDRAHEIVLSCHLDHPSPGANDNASGCAGILEVARSLHRLIAEGKLPRPKRTIRFIWPCEVECTIALLNARPEFAARALATIHLDMIGGNTDITHGVLKVEGSPPSLPSFVSDVGFAIGRWTDEQSRLYADHGAADFPLTEPDGTKNPLRARIGGFTEGSDHQVWAEGSWRVPVIYIADWPDIYIHTQKDVPANLDSTKMRRAIFIAAASAWALANLGQEDTDALTSLVQAEIEEMEPASTRRVATLDTAESVNLLNHDRQAEADVRQSGERFGIALPQLAWWHVSTRDPPAPTAVPGPESAAVYRRKPEPKGPMDGFGYSWLDDHLKRAGLKKPALLSREASEDGPSFGYETLNLVDGRRSVQEIRDALAVTVAPAPVDEVADYLATLEKLGVLERVRP